MIKIEIEEEPTKIFVPRVRKYGKWFWYTGNRQQFIKRDYTKFQYTIKT
jgi:hypothetical protein